MKFKFVCFFFFTLYPIGNVQTKYCVLNELDVHLLFGYYGCTVV